MKLNHATEQAKKNTRKKNIVMHYVKVYMTDFLLFARLNFPNVLISVAKKIFDSDFPSPCFDVPKASNFTWGTKPRHRKQETGNDCDVNSGFQASRKTDFSVIFLLWANQFAKKWYNSVLFMRK